MPLQLPSKQEFFRTGMQEVYVNDFGNPFMCSICQACSSCPQNPAVQLKPCNHIFHYNCITPWLSSLTRTCPMCRQILYNKGLIIDLSQVLRRTQVDVSLVLDASRFLELTPQLMDTARSCDPSVIERAHRALFVVRQGDGGINLPSHVEAQQPEGVPEEESDGSEEAPDMDPRGVFGELLGENADQGTENNPDNDLGDTFFDDSDEHANSMARLRRELANLNEPRQEFSGMDQFQIPVNTYNPDNAVMRGIMNRSMKSELKALERYLCLYILHEVNEAKMFGNPVNWRHCVLRMDREWQIDGQVYTNFITDPLLVRLDVAAALLYTLNEMEEYRNTPEFEQLRLFGDELLDEAQREALSMTEATVEHRRLLTLTGEWENDPIPIEANALRSRWIKYLHSISDVRLVIPSPL